MHELALRTALGVLAVSIVTIAPAVAQGTATAERIRKANGTSHLRSKALSYP